MAEVRKAVREDKYGTAKIKKETKEKAKSEKKAVKKNNKSTEQKKGLFTRFRIFCITKCFFQITQCISYRCCFKIRKESI